MRRKQRSHTGVDLRSVVGSALAPASPIPTKGASPFRSPVAGSDPHDRVTGGCYPAATNKRGFAR